MATSPLPRDAAELPDDELDRLFVLGHRWALEGAERIRVDVVDPSGSAVLVDHDLPVATAPALVACKFHAIADRRGARSEKRESDAIDLVRLIGDLLRTAQAVEPFRAAPFDLAALVALQTDAWLIQGATRVARLMHLGAGAGDAPMAPADISAIGSLFTEMLAD
jgi:hypothetical protein